MSVKKRINIRITKEEEELLDVLGGYTEGLQVLIRFFIEKKGRPWFLQEKMARYRRVKEMAREIKWDCVQGGLDDIGKQRKKGGV